MGRAILAVKGAGSAHLRRDGSFVCWLDTQRLSIETPRIITVVALNRSRGRFAGREPPGRG